MLKRAPLPVVSVFCGTHHCHYCDTDVIKSNRITLVLGCPEQACILLALRPRALYSYGRSASICRRTVTDMGSWTLPLLQQNITSAISPSQLSPRCGHFSSRSRNWVIYWYCAHAASFLTRFFILRQVFTHHHGERLCINVERKGTCVLWLLQKSLMGAHYRFRTFFVTFSNKNQCFCWLFGVYHLVSRDDWCCMSVSRCTWHASSHCESRLHQLQKKGSCLTNVSIVSLVWYMNVWLLRGASRSRAPRSWPGVRGARRRVSVGRGGVFQPIVHSHHERCDLQFTTCRHSGEACWCHVISYLWRPQMARLVLLRCGNPSCCPGNTLLLRLSAYMSSGFLRSLRRLPAHILLKRPFETYRQSHILCAFLFNQIRHLFFCCPVANRRLLPSWRPSVRYDFELCRESDWFREARRPCEGPTTSKRQIGVICEGLYTEVITFAKRTMEQCALTSSGTLLPAFDVVE